MPQQLRLLPQGHHPFSFDGPDNIRHLGPETIAVVIIKRAIKQGSSAMAYSRIRHSGDLTPPLHSATSSLWINRPFGRRRRLKCSLNTILDPFAHSKQSRTQNPPRSWLTKRAIPRHNISNQSRFSARFASLLIYVKCIAHKNFTLASANKKKKETN